MTYDENCYTLATQFLSDEMAADHPRFAEMADRLAKQIQGAVEDFMNHDEIFVTVPRGINHG